MDKEQETALQEKRPATPFRKFADTIGKAAADTSTKTKNLAVKAQETIVNAVDKNGNGKIDAEDFGLGKENLQEVKGKVSHLASLASQGVKDSSERIGKAFDDARLDIDLKNLRPVFAENLLPVPAQENRTVSLPRLLCIVERDKKRSESEVCVGSIGYRTTIKGTELLNLYADTASQLGIRFFPTISNTIYYVDPSQSNLYIALDEYFSYLKKARVNELEMIAQKLGAKHVLITFQQFRKSLISNSIRGTGKFGAGKGSVSRDQSSKEIANVEIAADVEFSGHTTPTKPELTYFQSEGDIERLIQMRTGSNENQIKSKTYRFQCSKLSGISAKEAAQIDAVLSSLKCAGSASVSSEAQCESRTELEYKIEF